MAVFFVAFAYVVLTREFEQQKRASGKNPETPCYCYGAGGRNRTDMELPPRDFESRASTSFTTPAHSYFLPQQLFSCQSVFKYHRGFPIFPQ